MKTPSEYDEAVRFSESLKCLKIPHWHLIQENVINHPGYFMKMKRQGWNKGVSDYIIFIPKEKSFVNRSLILFMELKKQKVQLGRSSKRGKKGDFVSQNEPSLYQLQFIDMMRETSDVEGAVCHGADAALEWVSRFLVQ